MTLAPRINLDEAPPHAVIGVQKVEAWVEGDSDGLSLEMTGMTGRARVPLESRLDLQSEFRSQWSDELVSHLTVCLFRRLATVNRLIHDREQLDVDLIGGIVTG